MPLTWTHLTTVAEALDVDSCFLYEGRFHFFLDDRPHSIVVSLENGGRLRVDTFTGCTRRGTTGWVFTTDLDRLKDLARAASGQLQMEVGVA